MHSPYGLVRFVVFEKFTRAYLFQIAREKSGDYLLIIYTKKITSTTNLQELIYSKLREKNHVIRESSFNMTREWGGMKILKLEA